MCEAGCDASRGALFRRRCCGRSGPFPVGVAASYTYCVANYCGGSMPLAHVVQCGGVRPPGGALDLVLTDRALRTHVSAALGGVVVMVILADRVMPSL